MSKDYNEIWLESMSLLIDHRLQGLNFDKTIKCQILADKGCGTYLVQENDVVKYEAISTNAVYEVDDWVYVIIPNGDYNSTKIIISKYTEDPSQSPVNYIPPLGTFVPMTGNLAAGLEAGRTFGILANGSDLPQDLQNPGESLILKHLAEFDLTQMSEEIRYNEIYDTLGVSADFKTLFNGLDMQSGSYGLRMFLIENGKNPSIADFDSSDMFGDPYSYNFYLTQSKKFDISSVGNIDKIILVLYQKDDFRHYNKDGEIVKVSPTYTMLDKVLRKPDNILVQNIQIQLGRDILTIADNTFELTVPGGESTKMQYDKNSLNEAINTKTIYATWYNKTEDNEFIGFSDGIVDTKYDEDAYMEELETQMAGATLGTVSGIPRLKESLQIYSNAQKIEKELKTIHSRVGSDLQTVLTNLYVFIKNNGLINEVISKFNPIIRFDNNNLIAYGYGSIQDYLNNYLNIDYDGADSSNKNSFLDNYINYLNKADDYILFLKDEWNEDSVPKKPDKINLNSRRSNNYNAWTTVKNQINELYTYLNQVIIDQNHHGDIRAYVDRSSSQMKQYIDYIEQAHKAISEMVTQTSSQINIFDQRLINKDLTAFEEQYEKFTQDNANKYCIYWYRKSKDAEGDRWVEPGWKRLEFSPISSTPGMPQVIDDKYEKRSNNPLKIKMNHNVARDFFKAVLFFNHVPYWSNELEFINLDPPIDTSGADLKGALYIELSHNASASYQKYGSSFALLNMSDAMINRETIIRYSNTYTGEGDEVLAGCWVYWYMPLNATMLAADESRLTREGFSILSQYKNNSEFKEDYNRYYKKGYECYFKKIRIVDNKDGTVSPDHRDVTFYHLIKPVFNPSYTQNELICVVNRGGVDYSTSYLFTFSTFGTSGTDFTLSIVPTTTQYAVERIDNQTNRSLPIRASFSGYDGTPVENPPAITTSWWKVPVPTGQINPLGAAVEGSIDYEITFNTDLNNPESNCLYKVLECQADWNQLTPEIEADQTITLKSYYPVATAAGMYYMTGPTTIIYDDAGNNPVYSNEPYRLFYRTTNEELQNLSWKIIHYKTSDKGQLEGLIDDESLLRYLPTIGWYDERNTNIRRYKLKPLTIYVEDLYAYSVVLAMDASGKCIFAQPLFISQNRYGCSMLNTWDEKLLIDEENNIILASMMGAGYKDNENRFYGVLMGNVGEKMKNESMKVGIYGINEGYQSFGLTVDGKAFFGKNGRGQIRLDGNKGTIRSASYDLNNGDSGMLIDLDDAFIDMKGTMKYAIEDFESLTVAQKRSCQNYAEYEQRFGPLYKHALYTNKDGELVRDETHIRLDVQSPYFQITSAANHKILHIANDAYYFESDNYLPGKYNWEDRKIHDTLGTGTKFDLQNGLLDSFNLKIQSNNILLDSSEKANPYFIIKDSDGCNIFYAGTDNYYLQTHGYTKREPANPYEKTTKYGVGTKIDLQNNSIDAYDFYIRGEESSNEQFKGSYMLLSSEPIFKIHLVDSVNKYDLDLLSITTTEFIMHSANWGEKETTSTTTTSRTATVQNASGGLAVRTGPSTAAGKGYKTVSYNMNGTTFQVYGSATDEAGNTWWSLNPDNSIGKTDSMWSAQTHNGETYLLLSNPSSTTTSVKSITGAEINMTIGKLTFSKNTNALFIDAEAPKYPIQLGLSTNPVLKFGWDGSIFGGTEFNWSILSNGNATFNMLNANGGYFDGITIGKANVTGSFIFSGKSYFPNTFSIKYLAAGAGSGWTGDVASCITSQSEVKVTLDTADFKITVFSTGDVLSAKCTGMSGDVPSHSHTIAVYGGEKITCSNTIQLVSTNQTLKFAGATGMANLIKKEMSGSILASAAITDSWE